LEPGPGPVLGVVDDYRIVKAETASDVNERSDAEEGNEAYSLLLGELDAPEHGHGKDVDEQVVEDVGDAVDQQGRVGVKALRICVPIGGYPVCAYGVALLENC
jgi:hypothetical protein